MRPLSLTLLMSIAAGCAVEGEAPLALVQSPRQVEIKVEADASAKAQPQPQSRLEPTIAEPADRWQVVEQMLMAGVQKEDVYSITVPRDDFAINHLDLGPVPPAAGIESSFHFFLCPCGKTSVMGQFVLQEHEVNDVIDELRAAHVKVASVAPMMLNAQPRLYVLRFHGEGDVQTLANSLKSALEWTGWQPPTSK